MSSPDINEPFEYAGMTIGCEWFDATSIDVLPDVAWQQVYAIANLDGKVPVVLYEDAQANLPGGKAEPGETIEQTLRREIMEELNCRVIHWEPIGYQKLSEPGSDKPKYQLRVYAELEMIGEFVEDSGGNVIGYEVVELDKLNDAINYGKVGERMVELVKTNFIIDNM